MHFETTIRVIVFRYVKAVEAMQSTPEYVNNMTEYDNISDYIAEVGYRNRDAYNNYYLLGGILEDGGNVSYKTTGK